MLKENCNQPHQLFTLTSY